jgi:midasin (ATPase involved in ribosome maturation)
MKHSHSAAVKRLCAEDFSKQKGDAERRLAWEQMGLKLLKLETQLKTQSALAFSFIEGSLVKALREGKKYFLSETLTVAASLCNLF